MVLQPYSLIADAPLASQSLTRSVKVCCRAIAIQRMRQILAHAGVSYSAKAVESGYGRLHWEQAFMARTASFLQAYSKMCVKKMTAVQK